MAAEISMSPVLVVDDDASIIDLINLALSDEGFPCRCAANGLEAMSCVEERAPSLILLDISMPVMNGKEFYRWLRANGHKAVPVVVMTAGPSAARTCQELGAEDYLAKPFDLSDLLACVGKWARIG